MLLEEAKQPKRPDFRRNLVLLCVRIRLRDKTCIPHGDKFQNLNLEKFHAQTGFQFWQAKCSGKSYCIFAVKMYFSSIHQKGMMVYSEMRSTSYDDEKFFFLNSFKHVQHRTIAHR